MYSKEQKKKPKKKKCKNPECGKFFVPTRPMMTTCGFSCAIAYSKSNKAKKDKVKADIKEKTKSRSQNKSIQLKKAQELVNRYVRLRDSKNYACISCGHTGNRQVYTHRIIDRWDKINN